MVFDVRRLDIYRKTPKDLTQPTLTGAIISVCCCFFIAFLFITEFWLFFKTSIVSDLYVDHTANDDDKILVRLNVTLTRLNCDVIGLDIQDDMGRHEVGFVENIEKTPLPEVGCQFHGKFYINKVPGNFHVSTHSAAKQPDQIDMSHIIQEVTFGEKLKNKEIQGSFNSLAGRKSSNEDSIESHDYVMKIVPTIYEDLGGKKTTTFQYTYAYRSYISFGHTGRVIPAIWFRYDLNPITVKYRETRPPIYSFLTTICAIIGGTFTVAGIIDACVFTASELLRKAELGKLS